MDGAELRLDESRTLRIGVSDCELDAARFGFHRAFPLRSAKRVLFVTQALALIALVAGFVLLMRAAPGVTLEALHLGALGLFAIALLLRLIAAAHLAPVLSRIGAPQTWPVYTVLCPLYREANIAADLVAALNALDYPRDALDLKLLVEEDDAETVAAVSAAGDVSRFEIVIIPPASPRTKPKALNIGLARAHGKYIVVYDAEDRPHPQQLRAALAAFEDGGDRLACVQAPLVADNAGASWIARQFAAEYAIQFREMLPLLARWNLPLPLGGSSNHFRTEALRVAGGWDPYNVSEDHRKFPNNFDELQGGTLHVPITSQSEKWSAKGLIGKEKARDRFNVSENLALLPRKISTLCARDFECPVLLSFLWVTAKSA